MRRLWAKYLMTFFLIAMAIPAGAMPIHWTLTGITFSDGATAVGSFDFDAALSTYSNVLITTSPAGTSYATADIAPNFGADANGLNVIAGYLPMGDNTGFRLLNLDFVAPLTGAGGVVPVLVGFPSFEGTCGTAACSSGAIDRVVVAGSVTSTVPEPASMALLIPAFT